jgi:hypothetical protein
MFWPLNQWFKAVCRLGSSGTQAPASRCFGSDVSLLEPIMKRAFMAGAIVAAALGLAAAADAQAYYPLPPPLQLQPAMPESMPTVEPFSATAADDLSGTAQHTITATPDCGAANPQGGIPSMVTGTCP